MQTRERLADYTQASLACHEQPRCTARHGDEMDTPIQQTLAEAVEAIDQAISGLLGFAMTLRPTLRNEILQICGPHLERARQAKQRLEALLNSSAP